VAAFKRDLITLRKIHVILLFAFHIVVCHYTMYTRHLFIRIHVRARNTRKTAVIEISKKLCFRVTRLNRWQLNRQFIWPWENFGIKAMFRGRTSTYIGRRSWLQEVDW